MKSANVNFDEFIEVDEAKPMKELEEYKSFGYFYKSSCKPTTSLSKCQGKPTNVKLNSKTKLYSDTKL